MTGRLKKCVLISFLLFICGTWVVFDHIFMPFGVEFTTLTVPNFCGRPEGEIEKNGSFAVETVYRYDGETEEGIVISQSPPSGSVCKLTANAPRCKLKLVVSLGRQQAKLPQLLGTDYRRAEATLRELGFAVTVKKTEQGGAWGRVLFMDPPADTTLPVGSGVTLYVSKGKNIQEEETQDQIDKET